MRKIMSKALVAYLFITIIIGGCGMRNTIDKTSEGEKAMSEISNPKNDTEILKRWFPAVKKIDSSLWEAGTLSTNEHESVPGPSVIYAKGVMYIEENQINEWFEKYDFEEAEIDFQSDYWDKEDYEREKWYFSWDFNDDLKPGYY